MPEWAWTLVAIGVPTAVLIVLIADIIDQIRRR